MSRSYKHTPRCGDKKDKFFKNYANKKLRRKKLTHQFQHKSYKKDFCSYDICDYENIGTTFKEFYAGSVNAWYNWQWKWDDFPDEKKEYQQYMKWFKRK